MRWEVRTLGEVCHIIGGGTPSKKVERYYGGTIPWATVGDMNVEILEKTDLYLSQEGLNNSSAKIIPSGNVIIATRVGLGKSCILHQDTAINQDLKGLVPKHPGDVSPKFLFRWTQMKAADIIKAGTGATVQGVKIAFVTGLRLAVPPMEEQERIVEILDQAFEAIDKAKANIERNLANARELFQSRLNEIFSNPPADWEMKPLGSLCQIKTGPFGSMLHKSDYSMDGVPVVNPADFAGGSIAWNSCKRIPEIKAQLLKAYLLVELDVVMARRGEIGRNAVFKEARPALCGTGSLIVRPVHGIDSEFLHFQLNSPTKRLQLESLSSGATMKNLSAASIKGLAIAAPSNSIQNIVVGQLNNLRASCANLVKQYKQELLSLEELRQSILEQAFEGKLTEPATA